MSSSPEIELISFDLCPYVQRSVITLNEKAIEFKRTNIDLANKPDWFLAISPLGKVPVLKIGENILFESTVINEYLDEITPSSLHPADPFEKAQNRAWIEFAGTLFGLSFRHLSAKDEQGSKDVQDDLFSKLEHLEKQLGEGPFFNGKNFCLIDSTFAPFFIRTVQISSPACGIDLLSSTPKVKAWAETLLSRASVISSMPDDFINNVAKRFSGNGGWLATRYLQQMAV